MIELQSSDLLCLLVVIHPKIQQEICRDFQKSVHFTVSQNCSLLRVTVRQGDPSESHSVYEKTHLALHHFPTKANNRGSKRANSCTALTHQAKNGNLVPLLTFQHQIPFSCPTSLSKSEQVSTAPSCTKRQAPLFRRSSTSNFYPLLQRLPFSAPFFMGILIFFCLIHSPEDCLITGFRAQHRSNCIFFSNVYSIVCSRSQCSKVSIHQDIKSDPQKRSTC